MSTDFTPDTEQPETRVLHFRQQGRRLYFVSLVLIVLAGTAPYILSVDLETWMLVLAAGAFAFVLLFLVLGPYVRWLSQTTVVTTRRIIAKSGVFKQQRIELLLSQVAEMKLRRGPVQRAFRTGDIFLRSASGGVLVLKNVPDILANADALQEMLAVRSYGRNA